MAHQPERVARVGWTSLAALPDHPNPACANQGRGSWQVGAIIPDVMTFLPIRRVAGGVQVVIDISGAVQAVTYTSEDTAFEGSGDAGLAAMLMPAMSGAALWCPRSPCRRNCLFRAEVQEIIRNWEQRYPRYRRYQTVTVTAPTRPSLYSRPGRGVAAFFTGGVNSFYTLFKHREEIDALVSPGVRCPLEDKGLASLVGSRLRAAATMLDKPLLGSNGLACGD